MPVTDPGSLHAAGRICEFFAAISGRYDLANHLLSGGLDFLWRREAARVVAGWQPERVLDLACGSGDLSLALEQALPGKTVVAADFCEPMLERARAKGVRNLKKADALQMPFADGEFDAVTVAFGLRNMESWPKALREIRRVLKAGGHLLVLDFSMPKAPLRWIYRPYLHRVLPALARLVTGERAAYEYLGESIEAFPSGAAMAALLEENGFEALPERRLHGGIVTLSMGEAA